MRTLTIRLSDDKHSRLTNLAKYKDISINKLIDEIATITLTTFDAEIRFRTLAAKGSREQGLKLLDKLDNLT